MMLADAVDIMYTGMLPRADVDRLRAIAWRKRCACGLTYTLTQWRTLRSCGVQRVGDEVVGEYRDCACGSSILSHGLPPEPETGTLPPPVSAPAAENPRSAATHDSARDPAGDPSAMVAAQQGLHLSSVISDVADGQHDNAGNSVGEPLRWPDDYTARSGSHEDARAPAGCRSRARPVSAPPASCCDAHEEGACNA